MTLVDVNDQGSVAGQMSVSARHEAVLADGRHVLLLDGRGWTSSALIAYGGDIPGDDLVQDQPDIGP